MMAGYALIAFIINIYDRLVARTQLLYQLFRHCKLRIRLRVGSVRQYHYCVGMADLFKGTPESLYQVVRQIADKAYRISHQHLFSRRKHKLARCRVECGKKLVLREDARIRQPVEQCGFARIGITRYGKFENTASVSLHPLHFAVFRHLRYLRFEHIHSALDMAPVCFKFALARSSRADTAAEPRKLKSLADKARHGIFQLRQLYLELTLARHGMQCENIEYEHTAVYHVDIADIILKIPYLRGRKLTVEYHCVNLVIFAKLGKLADLSLSDICPRIGRFLILHHPRKNLNPCRFAQALQLRERDLCLVFIHVSCHERDKDSF